MEKFNPSELCADIKIYDYKKKVKYDENAKTVPLLLVIFQHLFQFLDSRHR